MADDPSIILFATNAEQDSDHYKAMTTLVEQENKRCQSKYRDRKKLKIESAYTTEGIISALREHEPNLVGIHFEGQLKNYQELLKRYQDETKASLPYHLGRLKQLKFVFLNGCNTKQFTDELATHNVPVIIGTPHIVGAPTLTDFADKVHEKLIERYSLQEAFDHGIDFIRDKKNRSFIILGEPKARSVRIIGSEPDEAASWPYPDPNRKKPIHGSKPLTEKQQDLLVGRNKEIDQLFESVCSTYAESFILLHGKPGSGKTSLVRAGLLPKVKDMFQVITISGTAEQKLETQLANALGTNIKPNDISEAWRKREQNGGNGKASSPILLVVDEIDHLVSSREISDLAKKLKPLFENVNSRSCGKVLISCRPTEAQYIKADIEHQASLRTNLVQLKTLGKEEFKEAMRKPFVHDCAKGKTLEDSVIDCIAEALQSDSHSIQMPYLQAILEQLWLKLENADSNSKITLTEYHALQESGELLLPFLNEQISQTQKRLKDKLDELTLLKILTYHTTHRSHPQSRKVEDVVSKFRFLPTELARSAVTELYGRGLLTMVESNHLYSKLPIASFYPLSEQGSINWNLTTYRPYPCLGSHLRVPLISS